MKNIEFTLSSYAIGILIGNGFVGIVGLPSSRIAGSFQLLIGIAFLVVKLINVDK
jgi:hypothetical protein